MKIIWSVIFCSYLCMAIQTNSLQMNKPRTPTQIACGFKGVRRLCEAHPSIKRGVFYRIVRTEDKTHKYWPLVEQWIKDEKVRQEAAINNSKPPTD